MNKFMGMKKDNKTIKETFENTSRIFEMESYHETSLMDNIEKMNKNNPTK